MQDSLRTKTRINVAKLSGALSGAEVELARACDAGGSFNGEATARYRRFVTAVATVKADEVTFAVLADALAEVFGK